MLTSTFAGSLCIQESRTGNWKSFMIGAKVCSGFILILLLGTRIKNTLQNHPLVTVSLCACFYYQINFELWFISLKELTVSYYFLLEKQTF